VLRRGKRQHCEPVYGSKDWLISRR
jgi:hypothetical protein